VADGEPRIGIANHAPGIAIAGHGPADQAPGIGDRAPGLALAMLDGAPLLRADLTGETTIVDFFATWCGPCHKALADLEDVEARLPSPVRLIVVAVGEDADVVRRYIAQHSLPRGAELALDPGAAVARAWGQERFPTTFVVDHEGVIRHINRGWGRGYAERMLRWLGPMVSHDKPPLR